MTDDAKSAAPGKPGKSRRWLEQRGVALIALAIAWFYLWTATSASERLSFEPHGLDYYNLLVDGFLDGHLSINYAGDPGLAKLKDPYDPAQNAPYRVLDMSYYKGKYYIYFGPTPALVLLLPWKVITGVHLPTHLAAVIFATGGYWISILLLLNLRRRYFPETGTGAVWLATLLLGLGNMAPALLRRPSVYELAIACAYFFVMLAFWALEHALTTERWRLRWLALASAAYGLALLARPTCLYGAVIFALVLGWWWLGRDRAEGWMPCAWRRSVWVAAVPLGLIFTGMLLYNYLRFDNPFEFGQIYQLTARDMGKVKAFSWSYLPFNAWLYLLMPAQHSGYFPFFLNALPPPMPKGYDGLDDLYGLLPNLPVVLLAGGICFGASDRGRQAEFRFFGLMLGIWFLAVFGVFLFFSGATIRYYLDFLPALLLLACLGLWSIGRVVRQRPRLKATVWIAMTGLAFFSITFAVMVSFEHAGLLRAVNPTAFNRLARVGNYASRIYDKLAGTHYGPLRVELKFPRDRRGQFEPLLVSGAFPAVDYLWVLYTDDQHVQIGYEHTNYGGASTQPIRIDYGAVHTLEIDAGFLYPPEAHPYFPSQSTEAIRRVRTLVVVLDGVPYLDTHPVFYDPVSPDVEFGRNRVSDTFGRRFTGELRSIKRTVPSPLLDMTPQMGPVQMAVLLPQGQPRTREPLVVTGETGRGDLLFIEYVDPTHVRFGLDHWGVGLVLGEPVPVSLDQIQVIEASLGSLSSPADPGMKNRLVVRFNGVTVLDHEMSFHPAAPESQTFGINLIGGSTCGPAFTGKILSIKRRNQW